MIISKTMTASKTKIASMASTTTSMTSMTSMTHYLTVYRLECNDYVLRLAPGTYTHAVPALALSGTVYVPVLDTSGLALELELVLVLGTGATLAALTLSLALAPVLVLILGSRCPVRSRVIYLSIERLDSSPMSS
jgi:hypothetical protein